MAPRTLDKWTSPFRYQHRHGCAHLSLASGDIAWVSLDLLRPPLACPLRTVRSGHRGGRSNCCSWVTTHNHSVIGIAVINSSHTSTRATMLTLTSHYTATNAKHHRYAPPVSGGRRRRRRPLARVWPCAQHRKSNSRDWRCARSDTPQPRARRTHASRAARPARPTRRLSRPGPVPVYHSRSAWHYRLARPCEHLTGNLLEHLRFSG